MTSSHFFFCLPSRAVDVIVVVLNQDNPTTDALGPFEMYLSTLSRLSHVSQAAQPKAQALGRFGAIIQAMIQDSKD